MNNFEEVSIVGSGLSAWMMCAFMAKQLQYTDTKITIYTGVEPESIADIQSPLPLINEFFKAINVSPEALSEAVEFHPKLGNAYLFDSGNPFFHVWGQYGAPMDVIEFHQVVMRCLQLGHSVDLNKLSISSASVLAGKYQKPVQKSNSIFSTYESSWSFKTETFLQLLKSISKQLGVEVSEEKVVRLAVDEVGGYVFGESDAVHKSDYLINTVPGLMGESQQTESWFKSLPIRLESQARKKNSLSRLVNKVKVLGESSWLCEVSHRNLAVWNIYQFVGQDAGDVYVHEKPRLPKCLNFGSAMANIYSPLFSPMDLDLIALKLLMRYFPSPSDGEAVAGEFNKALRGAFENLRDITQLCLKALFEKSNLKSPLMALSSQAEYKMDLFKRRGRYPVLENEFFKTEWQIWLLLGFGVSFESVEPMTSFVDYRAIKEHILKVENSVLRELQAIPSID